MFDTTAARPTPTASPAEELVLTLVGAGRSRRFQRPLTIGRGAGCDLRIDDPSVDDCHAEIYPVGAQWWVRDLGSDHGTFLRDELVEAEPLCTPSDLRLGAGGPTLRLEPARPD